MGQVKFKQGDVFEINLSNNSKGFGIVLINNWGFFNLFLHTDETLRLDEIFSSEMPLRLWVSDFVLKKGLWRIIGNVEISEEHKSQEYFFKQAPITGQVWRTLTGAEEWPITIEECKDLEVAAVYDPEHVIERLEFLKSGEEDLERKFDINRLLNKGVSTK